MPGTPARPIPGHRRAKPEKSGYKSPRSPKSPGGLSKSPGEGGAKSPGGGTGASKSPYADLIAMSDDSLAEFKKGILNEKLR